MTATPPPFLIAEAAKRASREHVPMAAGSASLAPGTVLAVGDGGQWRAYDPAADHEAAGILLGAVIDGEALAITRHAEVWSRHMAGMHKGALRPLTVRGITVR